MPSATPSPVPKDDDACGGYGRLLTSLNRPAIGYSTCVAPVGTAILEEGYQNTVQGGANGSIVSTYPRGLQRIGVLPQLELVIIGPNQNHASADASIANGLSDIGAGFKYGFRPGGRVQWAIDGLFTAASGARAFTSGGATSQVNLDASYSLTSAIGFATTIGVASLSAPYQGSAYRYGNFGAVLPSFEVTDLVDRSSQLFAEYACQTKIAPDLGGESLVDFGIQQLFGPNVQIDIEDGIGLTPINSSRVHYVGIGLGLYLK